MLNLLARVSIRLFAGSRAFFRVLCTRDKRTSHSLRHPLDDQRRHAKAGTVLLTTRQSTCHAALVEPCLGLSGNSWSPSLKAGDHPQKNLKGGHPRITNTPRRSAAFAHTLSSLDDEELQRFFAVGIAAWKKQEYAQWPDRAIRATVQRVAHSQGGCVSVSLAKSVWVPTANSCTRTN